ncbi:chromate efflux transporter [Pseudogemmobacter bohemicus]|uniref:chromate efflux transporter n=1 Tax=Pseudogemmobacter bohemicus TaxID=2250708 RepID=UPI000DD34EC3|nr:chromate efflux transporter [Pseudogemmobacter bohemicus]
MTTASHKPASPAALPTGDHRTAGHGVPPALNTLAAVFWRIGVLSFGGPAAQIALLHRVVLEENSWVSEEEYARALSFCMLLPGPEAMQLATWIGWRLQGVRGGLIAGGLFVLPGAVLITALAALYTGFGTIPLIPVLFTGIQAAVIAIVAGALIRLAQRALTSREARIIALMSFAGLFFLSLPFPLILMVAAGWGALQSLRRPATGLPERVAPPALAGATLRRGAVSLLIWLGLWLAPLAVLLLTGPQRLAEIGVFFSKLAALAFGGAYALLAWMSQEMVDQRGWLTTGQMIDGLALAESTPGPLILVTVFAGWIAAFQDGGTLMAMGGALVALWMTFLPSFLFIFTASPFIERLLAIPLLAGAMARITPAVVGVIANLSLWFAFHVLFAAHRAFSAGPLQMMLPEAGTLKPLSLMIALASGFALYRLRLAMPLVLVLAAGLALLAHFA